MKRPIPTRAALLKRYVREAAKTLGVRRSDGRARRAGVLLLARESLLDALAAQLVSGKAVDPTPYLRLEEGLRALLPPEPAVNSKLEIVVVGKDGKPISDLPPRPTTAPSVASSSSVGPATAAVETRATDALTAATDPAATKPPPLNAGGYVPAIDHTIGREGWTRQEQGGGWSGGPLNAQMGGFMPRAAGPGDAF